MLPVTTRNSSGDETANVNFYDDIFNYFYAVRPGSYEFGEITQTQGNYAVQGHSRSPILDLSKAHIDLLLVININLPPVAPFPRYSLR